MRTRKFLQEEYQEMYEGAGVYRSERKEWMNGKRRKKKGRKRWIFSCIALMFISIGCVSLLLTDKVSVAAEKKAGQTAPPQETETDREPPQETEADQEPPQETETVQTLPQESRGPAGTVSGNVPEEAKVMYLTFDDGPSKENTDRILDILKERNIKATFFLVGENVRRYPETARRIAREGHAIGIHSNSHDYDTLYQSVESFVSDFEEARQIIQETTGVETVLFRFPGGSVNGYNQAVSQSIIEEMTKRGYIYFDWNASLEDATTKPISSEQLVKNGVESTLGRKKVIMLAHDITDHTVLCLEELLDSLAEYRMEPLTETVKPIQF